MRSPDFAENATEDPSLTPLTGSLKGQGAKAGDGLTIVQDIVGKGDEYNRAANQRTKEALENMSRRNEVAPSRLSTRSWPEPAFKVLDVDDEIEPLASILTSM